MLIFSFDCNWSYAIISNAMSLINTDDMLICNQSVSQEKTVYIKEGKRRDISRPAEYNGKNVLIVTHAANARIIIYFFQGKPKDYDFNRTLIKNGELITFEN